MVRGFQPMLTTRVDNALDSITEIFRNLIVENGPDYVYLREVDTGILTRREWHLYNNGKLSVVAIVVYMYDANTGTINVNDCIHFIKKAV
jgi:hypothetical protein